MRCCAVLWLAKGQGSRWWSTEVGGCGSRRMRVLIKGGWVVIVRGSCECGYKQSARFEWLPTSPDSMPSFARVLRSGSRAPNSAPAVPIGRYSRPTLTWLLHEKSTHGSRIAAPAGPAGSCCSWACHLVACCSSCGRSLQTQEAVDVPTAHSTQLHCHDARSAPLVAESVHIISGPGYCVPLRKTSCPVTLPSSPEPLRFWWAVC
jgi:hypothetical protein